MSVTVELKLLGQVNKGLISNPKSRVSPKYVVVVTAGQLSTLIRYRKVGKKNPYQIDPISLIKIDKVAQRGLTDDGFALQDEKKVLEIRDALLGISKEATRLYVGTLVWNVRPNEDSDLKVITELDPDKPHLPPTAKLKITANTIWLTDSAHRHFGIVEALSEWKRDPGKYPDFSDSFEFSIDLYNLDPVQENALFRELNAKQKKISASKSQQTDTGSALGLLKGTILARDQSQKKLFDQNIEVNSNENNRHTLMTMSVFTATVQNMFGKPLIDEARDNQSIRDELAQYYCDFFYKLRSTIRVNIDYRGGQKEVSPFQNLYEEIIEPAIDKVMSEETDEEKINHALNMARERASTLNSEIQREEKIHSNAVLKALSRIAGRIRHVKDWGRIIDLLQTSLIVANGGKYFQKYNSELLGSVNGGVPIAIKKIGDDTINIQVQDQTIREIERHLSEKLHLVFKPTVRVISDGVTHDATSERISFTRILSRSGETYFDVEVDFQVGSELPLGDEQIKLRIQALTPNGAVWKSADKVGKNRLSPIEVKEVLGYDHPYYSGGFTCYTIKFEVNLPKFTDLSAATFDLILEVDLFDIDGSPLKVRHILPVQPE
jgi:hypothetical protein